MDGDSLGDRIAARLLDEIVDGRYPPGTALPPEWELADREGASRLTVREAVRILRQQQVVAVVRGRGTFVQPRDQWFPLDPAVLAALARDPGARDERWRALQEAQALIEVGAAELAAQRRTDQHLATMAAALAAMQAADRDLAATRTADGDLADFAEADRAFREAVLAAAGNPVLSALAIPIARLLEESRRQDFRDPAARQRTRTAHERLLTAIEQRDQPRALGGVARDLAP